MSSRSTNVVVWNVSGRQLAARSVSEFRVSPSVDRERAALCVASANLKNNRESFLTQWIFVCGQYFILEKDFQFFLQSKFEFVSLFFDFTE